MVAHWRYHIQAIPDSYHHHPRKISTVPENGLLMQAPKWKPAGRQLEARGIPYGGPWGGICRPGSQATVRAARKASLLYKATFSQPLSGNGCHPQDAVLGSDTAMNYLQSDKRRAETAKSPTGLSQRDRTTDKRPEIIFRGKK